MMAYQAFRGVASPLLSGISAQITERVFGSSKRTRNPETIRRSMMKSLLVISSAGRFRTRQWLLSVSLALAAGTAPLLAHDDDDLSIIPPGQSGVFPYTNNNPVIHGKIGPLIVMHAMSVHNTMLWKTNDDTPKV